jgi:hypothetical protein
VYRQPIKTTYFPASITGKKVESAKHAASVFGTNNLVKPNRNSFGPFTKFDVLEKQTRLAHLLDPKTNIQFSITARGSPTGYVGTRAPSALVLRQLKSQENVRDSQEAIAVKSKPYFLEIKDHLRGKLNMIQGDRTSSPTEHESAQNYDSLRNETTEAVLIETPVSLYKNPVKLSAMTALPGTFNNRKSNPRSLLDQMTKRTDTVESIPAVIENSNIVERLTLRQVQTSLPTDSEANSNALGIVRRNANSRMSDHSDIVISVRTYPRHDQLASFENNSLGSSPNKQQLINVGDDSSLE